MDSNIGVIATIAAAVIIAIASVLAAIINRGKDMILPTAEESFEIGLGERCPK